VQHDEIVNELLEYIYDSNPLAEDARPLPLDKSLYELGILDSFAIVELVSFIESHWDIRILDAELTKEKFGGVHKMARLIGEKLGQPGINETDENKEMPT
jgi:acyl carrier protein